MSHSLFFLAAILSIRSTTAQTTIPLPEYSNGALELTVEHARPEREVTREGENLYGILTLRLKNISEETLTVVAGSPNCDFAIEISDSSGNRPKLTPLGEHLPKTEAEREECWAVSYRILEVQPGKEFSVRWFINKLFELEPGRAYSIRVWWARGLPAVTPSGRQLRRELSRKLTIK